MRSRNLVLSGMLFAAVAMHASSAPDQHAISADQVSDSINKMGLHLSPGQVTMLTNATATTAVPLLKVRSMEPWGDQRMLVRMECGNQKECLPFFVGIRLSQSTEVHASRSVVGPLSSAGPTAGLSPNSFVVQTGSWVTLQLDGKRVHIRMPVMCLERGAPGQTIRATGKDRRVIYTAEVVDGTLLKGRL